MQPQVPKMYSLTSLQQDFPDELPSWDFSQDVLGGLEQFMDSASSLASSEVADAEMREAIAAAPAAAEPSTSQAAVGNLSKRASSSLLGGPETRKQKQNRHAQQRFRQRQKVQALPIYLRGVAPRTVAYRCMLVQSPAQSQMHLAICTHVECRVRVQLLRLKALLLELLLPSVVCVA